jgi:hypothetical protein
MSAGVAIAAETVLVSPTTARRNGVGNAGRADVRVPEPRTMVEALVGGLPFVHVTVVFLQRGSVTSLGRAQAASNRGRSSPSIGRRAVAFVGPIDHPGPDWRDQIEGAGYPETNQNMTVQAPTS